MMLVNRRYSAGRSILNIDEVHEALQRRFGGIAEVQLRQMEGLSLRCASLSLACCFEQGQVCMGQMAWVLQWLGFEQISIPHVHGCPPCREQAWLWNNAR